MQKPLLFTLLFGVLCGLSACDAGSVSPSAPSTAPSANPVEPGSPDTPASSAPGATQLSYELIPCTYRSTDNLVSNGSFEAPIVRQERQEFVAGSQFTNWSIDSGSVALLGAGPPAADGNQALALNGTLSQTLSPLPNKSNLLTFCYAAAPGSTSANALSISWSGLNLGQLPIPPASGSQPVWQGVRVTLQPSTNNRSPLVLSAQGVMIDAVRVSLQ